MTSDTRSMVEPGFYIRCEDCGLVVPPSLVEYVLTADRRRADRAYPVKARCGACGHAHALPWTSVLPNDGTHSCPGCGVATSAPAAADRVACDGCNAHYLAASADVDRLHAVSASTEDGGDRHPAGAGHARRGRRAG